MTVSCLLATAQPVLIPTGSQQRILSKVEKRLHITGEAHRRHLSTVGYIYWARGCAGAAQLLRSVRLLAGLDFTESEGPAAGWPLGSRGTDTVSAIVVEGLSMQTRSRIKHQMIFCA